MIRLKRTISVDRQQVVTVGVIIGRDENSEGTLRLENDSDWIDASPNTGVVGDAGMGTLHLMNSEFVATHLIAGRHRENYGKFGEKGVRTGVLNIVALMAHFGIGRDCEFCSITVFVARRFSLHDPWRMR